MIERAVELISERGTEALSISALARQSGINRSTVYYHFESREALIDAVRQWSAEQIAAGFNPQVGPLDRIRRIAQFILSNPEVTKLWIEQFISTGEVRDRYPMWDSVVENVIGKIPDAGVGPVDPEVLCAIWVTGVLIGPRVFRNSVSPDEPMDTTIARFTRENLRIQRLFGLMGDAEFAQIMRELSA